MKTKLVMLAITALFVASSLRAGVEPICVDVKASVWTVGVGKVTEMAVIDGGLQGSLLMRFSSAVARKGGLRDVSIDFVASQDPSWGEPIHLTLGGVAYDDVGGKGTRFVKSGVSGVGGGGFSKAWGGLTFDGSLNGDGGIYLVLGTVCFSY